MDQDALLKLVDSNDNILKEYLDSYSKFVRCLAQALFSNVEKVEAIKKDELDVEQKLINYDSYRIGHLEVAYALNEALQSLRPREKAFINLFYIRGLTYKEISEATGMSQSTIRQIKSLALSKLHSRLSQFLQSQESPNSLVRTSDSETELIDKINTIFPSEKRKRYDELYAKFQQDKLTNKEYSELVKLGDEFESLNTKRLKYIGELADLRGAPFKETVREFKN